MGGWLRQKQRVVFAFEDSVKDFFVDFGDTWHELNIEARNCYSEEKYGSAAF